MNNLLIKKITGKEVLDSRKNPTVEVSLFTEKGLFKAAVPSGASTGKNEAIELRDGGKRLNGKGVLKAVGNINKIIGPKLKGKKVTDQKEIDDFLIRLDGTKNKSKLGANAICGVSMAVCRAGARAKNIPLWKYISLIAKEKPSLPTPCFNIINGGAHAGNDLDFQEFMVVPMVKPFSKSLDLGLKTYLYLKEAINERQGKSGLKTGDEGGFAPKIKRPEEALDLISEAVKKINPNKDIKIILDVASSQFFKKGEYKTIFGKFNSSGLIDYYFNLIGQYPIIGLEDPLAEEDWKGWKELKLRTEKERSNLLIIGDDLLTTNQKRIKEAKKKDVCNAMILKINQIGTVSEAIESGKLAKSFGWKIVVSHRSGETKDNFIADLAVGIGAEFIKTGAPFPVERMAKYNRLAEIEKELKN